MLLAPVLSVGVLWSAGMAGAVPPPPPDTTLPGANAPLVVVPPTCPSPDPAVLAFVGTVTGKDDIAQVVRFHIDQLRSGSASEWAVDGLIDIRFGDDYRFLDTGQQYLVGAGIDPEYTALSSHVRPPEPSFGGNDVVGVDDSAVECPQIDDPVRTLLVDGTDVDSGVMSLLFDDRRLLLATIAVPAAIAVQNAQVLEQTKRLAASLQGALSTKALIDQALGILRSRSGASSDEAFARLRTMSQTRNVKLAVVAESLVDEAVRRAKARHAGS